jgi:hypothetical protein
MGKCWERTHVSTKIGAMPGDRLSKYANSLIESCDGEFIGAIEVSDEFDNEKRGKYSWESKLAIITLINNEYIVKEYFANDHSVPYEEDACFAIDIKYEYHNYYVKQLIESLMTHDPVFKINMS